MRGELQVAHEACAHDDLQRCCTEAFGKPDPSAVDGSPLFSSRSNHWKSRLLYMTEAPGYRLFIHRMHPTSLQLYIEPVSGSLTDACQETWRGIRSTLSHSEPRLTKAHALDLETGRPIFTGSSGLGTHLTDPRQFNFLVLGLGTLGWSLVAGLTFATDWWTELLAGGVPSLIGLLGALMWATREARRGTIRWRG